MKSAFDGRSAARWFRVVAMAEAVSWVGLLVGMYFKYLGSPRTEIGVKVFGMAHGLIFISFVATGLLVGLAWIATFYVSNSSLPVSAIGSWNLVVGFGFLVAGVVLATRWH